jgi:hypothetical protein
LNHLKPRPATPFLLGRWACMAAKSCIHITLTPTLQIRLH